MRRFKIAFVLLSTITFAFGLQALTVNQLRCEDLDNPQGIDATQPRLSWILNSDEKGQRQTAYEILVASTAKNLQANQGDLWDSGKVSSDQSIQNPYAGATLASRAQCFWKVRVWDQDGKASAWSKPAQWTMGLLAPVDWDNAQWVGKDGVVPTVYLEHTRWIWSSVDNPEHSAPAGTNYFRRVVTIPAGRTVKSALFQYTGEDEARGWIGQFDLGARNNAHTVKFNDLTTRLNPGQTYVFGLTGYHKNGGSPAGVVGMLEIEFTEGPPMIIPTDEQWKVSDHEAADWLKTNFDDSDWVAAKNVGPVGMEPWGNVRSAESRVLAARYLRKEFSVSKKIAHATVSFSGLGLSELYLNGEKVSDHVLSPAFAQYNKREFYVTYDVTKQLQRGANAMGIILGNGRFFADRSHVYSSTVDFGFPKLLLDLDITYADGSSGHIVSDNSWKLTDDGPIQANNDYDGEEYDAPKEFSGWSHAGFDDSQWVAAETVSAPGGTLSAEMIDPIRVTGTLKPVSLNEASPGVYIYDMGQNMVGWGRLHVSGPAGTRVTMRYAETVKPDGSLYMANLRGAQVTDTYILKGQGDEVWEPRFVSRGFRYLEVRGFPGKPELGSIEGRVVNDDLPMAGDFECSNDLLNKIYHAIVWGVRGNYRSLPTDCPQRDERQGWLGDRSEESRGETYLFDNGRLYAKWMQDIADAQRDSGSEPDIAPAYWPIYSDNVVWPSTSVIIPDMLLEQFDDTRTIATHYDSMKRWMNFMSGFMTDGIISRDNYGDWCVPPADPQIIHTTDTNLLTDKALLATSFFYHDYKLMEQYATMLGKADDAQEFHKQAELIKTAFNQKFLDRQRGQYSNGTQTSCVLPLAFGLVPDDMHQTIFNHLVDKIENETHGHIGTGLVGGQYLCRVLTDNGRPDLVYTMASQKDYPGWGYMIENGATTIWELWNGNTADPTMNSGNHVMLIGDYVVWLYEDLAGIKTDPAQPGFQHIIMKPNPVNGLTFVKATHESPYGLISSEWHKNGNQFDWQIEIPANTTATVYVPAGSAQNVQAGAEKPVQFENGRAVFELGSGKYHFASEYQTTIPSAMAVNPNQAGIVKSEFIFTNAPFRSCHASTIAETKSGLVAAWFGGTAEGFPDVSIYVSRHLNGEWAPPVKVAEGTGFATNRFPCWNPVLFQPKSGPLLLFYKVGPRPAFWWGMMMTSTDDGATWSKPVRLPNGILGPIKNKPVQLPNGDILCGSSTEFSGSLVHFERTPDFGETWTATAPVNDGKQIGAIQPSILFDPHGQLEAIGRTTHSDKVFQIWSPDEGATWGKMSLMDLPNPNSGTDAVTLKDGRQLFVYNHNVRTGSHNKGRSPLNVAVSVDGTNWLAALVLEDAPDAPNGFAYPAVIQTSNGLVHITYTWERKSIRHVVIDPAKLELKPIVNGEWPK